MGPDDCPPSAVGYPPTAVGYPSIAVGYPPTAVGYPPTAVGYLPTAVGHPSGFLTKKILSTKKTPDFVADTSLRQASRPNSAHSLTDRTLNHPLLSIQSRSVRSSHALFGFRACHHAMHTVAPTEWGGEWRDGGIGPGSAPKQHIPTRYNCDATQSNRGTAMSRSLAHSLTGAPQEKPSPPAANDRHSRPQSKGERQDATRIRNGDPIRPSQARASASLVQNRPRNDRSTAGGTAPDTHQRWPALPQEPGGRAMGRGSGRSTGAGSAGAVSAKVSSDPSAAHVQRPHGSGPPGGHPTGTGLS